MIKDVHWTLSKVPVILFRFGMKLEYSRKISENYHRHHLPPWIKSFDLFWHRRVAIVSWGAHDLFFREVGS
jgi:hypothetical protein